MNEIAAALRRLHVLDREGVQQVTAAAVAEAVQPLREQVAALAQQLAAIAEQLAEASQADQSTTTQARRFGRRAN